MGQNLGCSTGDVQPLGIVGAASPALGHPFVLACDGCPLIYKNYLGGMRLPGACSGRLVPAGGVRGPAGEGWPSLEFDRWVTVAFQLTPPSHPHPSQLGSLPEGLLMGVEHRRALGGPSPQPTPPEIPGGGCGLNPPTLGCSCALSPDPARYTLAPSPTRFSARRGGPWPPPWPLPTSEMAPNPGKMPLDVTTRLSLGVRGIGICPPSFPPLLSLKAIERINLSGFMACLSHPTKPT